MYKVKVLIPSKICVMNGKEEIIRKCLPGEDVYMNEINIEDIKSGLYRPYKHQIIDKKGKEMKPEKQCVRQRPVFNNLNEESKEILNEMKSLRNEVVDCVNSLRGMIDEIKSVKNDTTVIDKKEAVSENLDINDHNSIIVVPGENKEIPEELFIEDGEEVIYGEADINNYHKKIRGIISANVEDDEHTLAKMDTCTHHLPKFAKKNMSVTKWEVEEEIKLAKQVEQQFPLLNHNGPISLVKDIKGRVDPFQSLGARVIRPED